MIEMYEELTNLIERLRSIKPVENEVGEPEAIEVLPPLAKDQMAEFDKACGGQMPAELDALLSRTAGLRGLMEFEPEPFPLEQDFIGTLRAYNYGNGDGIGLEVNGDSCRVWWLGHDPYFIIILATSITELLKEWLAKVKCFQDDGELFFRPDIESSAIDKASVRSSDDSELAAFLKELPSDVLIHDLRECQPRTEIPFERLEGLVDGGELRRHGLVFAFLPPRQPTFVAPLPVSHYLAQDLTEDERIILGTLPKGCMILHERDLPKGSKMDTSNAHPEQDISWKPPFHVLYPLPRPWWKFW